MTAVRRELNPLQKLVTAEFAENPRGERREKQEEELQDFLRVLREPSQRSQRLKALARKSPPSAFALFPNFISNAAHMRTVKTLFLAALFSSFLPCRNASR